MGAGPGRNAAAAQPKKRNRASIKKLQFHRLIKEAVEIKKETTISGFYLHSENEASGSLLQRALCVCYRGPPPTELHACVSLFLPAIRGASGPESSTHLDDYGEVITGKSA